jgi:hypothetical protein
MERFSERLLMADSPSTESYRIPATYAQVEKYDSDQQPKSL